ncbi:MAG: hypothetical protein OEY52_13460 [Gammaproteobacteria bacterium]|nr:hypothetical protein [Gammaproteobacteria bacterium]
MKKAHTIKLLSIFFLFVLGGNVGASETWLEKWKKYDEGLECTLNYTNESFENTKTEWEEDKKIPLPIEEARKIALNWGYSQYGKNNSIFVTKYVLIKYSNEIKAMGKWTYIIDLIIYSKGTPRKTHLDKLAVTMDRKVIEKKCHEIPYNN